MNGTNIMHRIDPNLCTDFLPEMTLVIFGRISTVLNKNKTNESHIFSSPIAYLQTFVSPTGK